MPQHPPRPMETRLWKKTVPEPNSGCLLWTAATIKSGSGRYYGVLGAGRRGEGLILAHRAAFLLSGGVIQPGQEVMHSCDVTLCVNPAHLSAGTRADNMNDCWRKGRRKPAGFCVARDRAKAS